MVEQETVVFALLGVVLIIFCLFLVALLIKPCPWAKILHHKASLSYWTRRAVGHRKRNDWANVEKDCIKAIELDPNSVKAHHFLGLALVQRNAFGEGIKKLQRALDLGIGKHGENIALDEIKRDLANAKYIQWKDENTKRARELQTLKEACEIALKGKYLSDLNQLELLKQVFAKVSEPDVPTEVPDYLCCKIMLGILHDPVITPSGITYERAAIIDHIRKVGKFDPLTNKPLKEYDLVQNFAVKEAVNAFLEKNPWAYKQD